MDELSNNDYSELIEAFELFDTDKNGVISVKELGCVMRALGLTPSESDLQDILNKIDKDGDGNIRLAEFLQLMNQEMKNTDGKDEIRRVFDLLDKNGDGYLKASEIRLAFDFLGEKDFTDDEIIEMIREADTNRDDFVDFNEFFSIISSSLNK